MNEDSLREEIVQKSFSNPSKWIFIDSNNRFLIDLTALNTAYFLPKAILKDFFKHPAVGFNLFVK